MQRILISIAAVLLVTGPAMGQDAGTPDQTEPVPAPPGPYMSSKPYLYPEGSEPSGQSLPYFGVMQYPMPRTSEPYPGPGRYWAPSDRGSVGPSQGFATPPTRPWGDPPQQGREWRGGAPGYPGAARNERTPVPSVGP